MSQLLSIDEDFQLRLTGMEEAIFLLLVDKFKNLDDLQEYHDSRILEDVISFGVYLNEESGFLLVGLFKSQVPIQVEALEVIRDLTFWSEEVKSAYSELINDRLYVRQYEIDKQSQLDNLRRKALEKHI